MKPQLTTPQHPTLRHGFFVLVAAIIAFGGHVWAQPDGPLGKVQQPLVGGTLVDAAQQEEFGLLDLDGSCSASLLRNNWAVTAAHCVDGAAPENVTLTAKWRQVQTRKAVRIETFAPYDIAIIQLDSPLKVYGSLYYSRMVLEDGTLSPRSIMAFGRGIFQFASGTGATAMPAQRDGKYRVGFFNTTRQDDTRYWFPSENGQMIAGGDSGGPSFVRVLGSWALMGVHSSASTQYVAGKSKDGWDWVTATPESADAPIAPVWNRILSIIGPAPEGVFGPTGNVGTFAKTPPGYQPMWVYGIRPNGDLMWYRKDGRAAAWEGPKKVGVGWGGFQDVIAAGGNRFYALTQDGKLLWYQHDGFNGGTFDWKPTAQVGNGWTFSRIFSGGDGIVYAIRHDGKLFWYRHLGFKIGDQSWSEAKEVGSGWGDFRDVFSLGKGAVYAVKPDGTLLLYQQRGFETGEKNWYPPRTVGSAWNQFQQIVPVGDGVILAVRPDGALIWYKHLGLSSPIGFGRLKDRWEPEVNIGSGWQSFVKVVALMPTAPDPVR